MNNLKRTLIAIGILLSGLALSPYVAQSFDKFSWQQFADIDLYPPKPGSGFVFLPLILLTNPQYFEGPWEQEDNDSEPQANGPIRLNQDYYGYPDDEYDLFYFNTENTGLITVDLSNHSGENVQLQLFYQTTSVENRLIAVFDPPYHVELHDQPPGNYIIYIFTEAGFNHDTVYTLRVENP